MDIMLNFANVRNWKFLQAIMAEEAEIWEKNEIDRYRLHETCSRNRFWCSLSWKCDGLCIPNFSWQIQVRKSSKASKHLWWHYMKCYQKENRNIFWSFLTMMFLNLLERGVGKQSWEWKVLEPLFHQLFTGEICPASIFWNASFKFQSDFVSEYSIFQLFDSENVTSKGKDGQKMVIPE